MPDPRSRFRLLPKSIFSKSKHAIQRKCGSIQSKVLAVLQMLKRLKMHYRKDASCSLLTYTRGDKRKIIVFARKEPSCAISNYRQRMRSLRRGPGRPTKKNWVLGAVVCSVSSVRPDVFDGSSRCAHSRVFVPADRVIRRVFQHCICVREYVPAIPQLLRTIRVRARVRMHE